MDEVLKISKGTINICIFDDNVNDLDVTHSLTKTIMESSDIAYTIDTTTQFDVINKNYHIFIIDVILNKDNSFNLQAQLIKQYPKSQFILISHDNSFVAKVELADDLYFVSKEKISIELPAYFKKCLGKAVKSLNYLELNPDKFKNLKYLSKEQRQCVIKRIHVTDIEFIKSERNYASINYFSNGINKEVIYRCPIYIFKQCLIDFEQFVLLNRSFLVNSDYIKDVNMESLELILNSGHTIPFSKNDWKIIYKMIVGN